MKKIISIIAVLAVAVGLTACENKEDNSVEVTEIGGRAFAECTSLRSIKIPDSITELEYFTFENCTSLEEVIISDIDKYDQADINLIFPGTPYLEKILEKE